MSSIASAVITALGTAITTGISGHLQKEELNRGEKASKELYLGDLAQRNKELKESQALARETTAADQRVAKANLAETKREFDLSYGLKNEELDMTKGEIARNTFRDQVQNLTGVLSKNEQLKSLYINRLKGLRN